MSTTRREFVKTSVATAAVSLVPYHWSSSFAQAEDQNSKLTIAAIGVGGSRGRFNQGRGIALAAANFGQMVAVCDVDQLHNDEFSDKHFEGKLKKYQDYRRLLAEVKPDVVTIGTPDHWHVPIAIAALESGAHVYCEKPLTLTIDEGKLICEAVKRSDRTFQVGTQQRSGHGQLFIKAAAMIRAGYVGDNVKVNLAIGSSPTASVFEPTEVPEGLDWDMWLGPVREVPYMEPRRKMFRWFMEYSGGKLTDWGAHHIDIAQWALGKDHSGPIKVSGAGVLPPEVPDGFDFAAFFAGEAELPHAYNVASKFDIDMEYEDGTQISVHDFYKSEDEKTKFPNGILFEGDAGRIFVNRGKLTGKPVEQLTEADESKLKELMTELYKNRQPTGHMRNFFDCIRDGGEPVADVFTHHRTMTACHLCNISLMLGREVQWDPKTEQFVNDEAATALQSRPSRAKYLPDSMAKVATEA